MSINTAMFMDLLRRYIQGDCQAVYDEIEHMGEAAFEKENDRVIHTILSETMHRVAYNIDVIYSGLLSSNYCFRKAPKHDFERPILKPRWNSAFQLFRLERAAKRFGYVPLSLKMFYRIVGSCNFTWDFETMEYIPWEGADALEIIPISNLIDEMKQLEAYEDEEPFGLPVAADYLHKDNTSGGHMYAVEITSQPSIDSHFLNEEHDTTFINYLRLTINDCGFSRAGAVAHLPDFANYYDKVKPRLKPI